MTQPHSLSATLTKRYVTALLDVAGEKAAVRDIAAGAQVLAAMIAGSPDFQKTLASPLLALKVQQRAVFAVLERARLHTLLTGFVGVVLHNRRGASLYDLLQAVVDEIARREGRIDADVQVATLMNDIQQKKLADSLGKWSGGKVHLNVTVTPEVMGGMKVRIGSIQIDDSVAGKLGRLKQSLLGSKARA